MERTAIIYASGQCDFIGSRQISEQQQRCKEYCDLYGIRVVEWIADTLPAPWALDGFDWPALERAVDMVCDGVANTLVLDHVDAIGGSLRRFGDIVDDFSVCEDTHLVVVRDQLDTSTATGRMILNILMSFAQYAKERVVETSEAPPYGFKLADDGRSFEPVASEQAVIAAVRELHSCGMDAASIRAHLVERGIKVAS